MKAVILSAGQGKRLLPLTQEQPKCAVSLHGRPILEWQLQALLESGISSVIVVAGFGVAHVETILVKHNRAASIQTLYNPFYALADNLISCWTARHAMDGDFILLNGDTLFEPIILERLLHAPSAPITLVTDEKPQYDADDMKVIVNESQLVRVGKTLPLEQVNGESIGMMRFQNEGPALFSNTLERRVREPASLRQWYLSLIDELAQQGFVSTVCIQGLTWAEIDNPEDLQHAEALFKPFVQ